MEHGVVNDIAICVIVAFLLAVTLQKLRLPLILSYLLAGFLVGPHGLLWISDKETIETISNIGLLLLLFMIGLEIDLKKMISAGRVITVTAAVQILGGCAIGWGFFRLTGLATGWLDASYLAIAAAMSSTVIIVKILYDKRELDTLPGRITLGVLVLQDLFAILFLAIQPNLLNPKISGLALSVGSVLLLVAVAFTVSRYVLPAVFRSVARLPEMVLVGALAWCFLMAGLASKMGLSREMGALVAGVAISTYPYTLDVAAKVTTIRDFFVTLFFVALGMMIQVPQGQHAVGTVVFSVFVFVSRLATVFFPLYKMRQGLRVSLLPAINLAQVSELSLVMLALGKSKGHLSEELVGIVAFSFAFLAVASTYLVAKNEDAARKMSVWLVRLGLRDLDQHNLEAGHGGKRRIFVLGFFWTASSLLEGIRQRNPALLDELVVLDFNPHVYDELRRRGVPVIYGDISQRDTLLHAGIADAEIILCTLPNTILKGTTNLKLLQQLRTLNSRCQIIMQSDSLAEIPQLYAAGADYVSVPRLLEADELFHVIEAAQKKLLNEKRRQMDDQLAGRAEVMP